MQSSTTRQWEACALPPGWEALILKQPMPSRKLHRCSQSRHVCDAYANSMHVEVRIDTACIHRSKATCSCEAVEVQVANSDAFDNGLVPGMEPAKTSCRQITAWQVVKRLRAHAA